MNTLKYIKINIKQNINGKNRKNYSIISAIIYFEFIIIQI